MSRIQRGFPVEKTHRYKLTKHGLHVALCYQRTYARVISPGLSIARLSTHASLACQKAMPLSTPSSTFKPLEKKN
jgi:hypothetical protein